MSKGIVLWNAREAKEKCEQFAKNYAQLRSDLLDHLEHKGHVALKYDDSMDGFFLYCREKLKLELSPKTIQLQIATAQVSREVGVEVPMVISRQLAKLPPGTGQRKAIYDEVIGAREVAGQRGANQMEPDVRKVVRREMGIVEKPAPEQSVTTDESASTDVHVGIDYGAPDGSSTVVVLVDGSIIDSSLMRDVPMEPAQETRTDEMEAETPISPPADYHNSHSFSGAVIVIQCFVAAYESGNQEGLLGTFMTAKRFLDSLPGE